MKYTAGLIGSADSSGTGHRLKQSARHRLNDATIPGEAG